MMFKVLSPVALLVGFGFAAATIYQLVTGGDVGNLAVVGALFFIIAWQCQHIVEHDKESK